MPLAELERHDPDLRLINLETAVTTADGYWKGKGINYRMHPKNFPSIRAAGIDCCTLANNHILDWGYDGLDETLQTLRASGVQAVGAGRNLEEARAPAVFAIRGGRRVLVFACGSRSSGIPRNWAATARRAGVHLLADYSDATARQMAAHIRAHKLPGDIVVLSLHWGTNWGYNIEPQERRFAQRLVTEAGVDVLHGHSSHHPKGIEVHGGRLILYGCGDLLNDYEGISGYERYRGDLGLMYFVTVNPETGVLRRLEMTPTQIRQFQIRRASIADARWLRNALTDAGPHLKTRVELDAGLRLRLYWE